MSDSRSQTTQTTYIHAPSAQQTTFAAEPEVLLDRYRVLARRGNGGFGTVCTCWDTRLQRRVAIKRMPLLGASETPGVLASTVDEALAEARTACLLAHPNIVTVHDFEIEGNYAYLVMEFVDGLNLSELLARVEGGYLTYAEAAHMVSSLAKALQYAHDNGVLHLDIKPTNIMIDRQGTVKLADFGMATLASAAGCGGARGGTVGYMPPEQVEGMLVDERADIFSLAVVLRQALTGSNVFSGRTAKESLDRIYKGPKIPLLKEDPEVPFAVDAALTQALSPEPSLRQGSISEFAQEIVTPLGNEKQGEKSLKALVEQSEEEETETWDVKHLPLSIRFPWLPSVAVRGTSALVTGILLAQLFQFIEPDSLIFIVVGSLVGAAIAALWTPLGSALVIACTAYALASISPTSTSFPFATLVTLVSVIWWAFAGRASKLSSINCLLGALLPTPVSAPALASATMRPLPAVLTGAFSYLFGTLLIKGMSFGFAATPLAYDYTSLAAGLPFWIRFGTCALSALFGSLISQKRRRGWMIFGQIVCATLLSGGFIWAAWMENPNFWVVESIVSVLITVFLCVFVCIAIVLIGPLQADQEGEELNELS